jgi:hypothetical protein
MENGCRHTRKQSLRQTRRHRGPSHRDPQQTSVTPIALDQLLRAVSGPIYPYQGDPFRGKILLNLWEVSTGVRDPTLLSADVAQTGKAKMRPAFPNYPQEHPTQLTIALDLVTMAGGGIPGFTGIITNPIQEAQEEGLAGLGKGFVRGTLGVVVKPTAGAVGSAGCLVKVLHREVEGRKQKEEKVRDDDLEKAVRSYGVSGRQGSKNDVRSDGAPHELQSSDGRHVTVPLSPASSNITELPADETATLFPSSTGVSELAADETAKLSPSFTGVSELPGDSPTTLELPAEPQFSQPPAVDRKDISELLEAPSHSSTMKNEETPLFPLSETSTALYTSSRDGRAEGPEIVVSPIAEDAVPLRESVIQMMVDRYSGTVQEYVVQDYGKEKEGKEDKEKEKEVKQ